MRPTQGLAVHHIPLFAVLVLATLGCKDKKNEAASPSTGKATTADASTATADPTPAPDAAAAAPPTATIATATAKLEAKSGSKVTGTVTFKTVTDGLEVIANVEGLTPGDHAMHVHEKGDCSAPDGASAGGHFNPTSQPHGAPDAEARHAGDFGNLTADKDGKATKTIVMKGITLGSEPTSVVGKGFIVHEKVDDMKTQPTGNAGGRVACGVIQLDKS